ncbi:MAG: ABC transporter permease [Methylobacteriaceae bacterium]|jgi:peptide/nickel transport system permease protein|nr:ABC transporter permease [Methylobacteriaceae bacterium]
MVSFLIQRLWQAVIVVFAMSVLIFCGVFAIGNPIDALISPDVTLDIREQIIARYGLDQPLWKQYFDFIIRVFHGDFGNSFVFNMPVNQLILQRLPATLELAVIAVVVATVIGIPLGMYAGYRPNTVASRTIMSTSILGFSVPSFWLGTMMVAIFATHYHWLPAGNRGETAELFGIQWSFLTWDGLRFLLLPAVNLGLFRVALMIRLSYASTREIMVSDTVKFARAAGLSEATILRKHVLKLISIPLVTVFGLELGSTLAFAVVTEKIFNWPGLGKLIIDSIIALDRPVMVAYLMWVSLLFVFINLLVDIMYAVLDPRLRKGRA